MKLCCNVILGACTIAASFAYAQQNIPQVKHVIIVVQENRTPDNLFGSDLQGGTRQIPSADLVSTAKCNSSTPNVGLVSLPLDTCLGPTHTHGTPTPGAWVTTYDDGAMDGACGATTNVPSSCSLPSNGYPQLTYVDNTSAHNTLVQPYFNIAKSYGFANYMFQTSQGPSFPAHQFLFTGTSAPDYYNDPTQNCGTTYPCWQWFAAENTAEVNDQYGCTATSDTIYDINPAGTEVPEYVLSGYGESDGWPRYNHKTMADLLYANNITWGYYPQGPNSNTSLWSAPNAISTICLPLDRTTGLCGGPSTGPSWASNVAPHVPPATPTTGEMAPILTDIQNCNLPQVSWAVPDGAWSDHPGCPAAGCTHDDGQESGDILGPEWVAAIVNTVGAATSCDTSGYWNDTVILITWDDWGGWYDHISPSQTGAPGIGYSNHTGDQYVYGFRVPLLVVSAYMKSAGYVSGACGVTGQPACPNIQAPYIHDFGSILNFVEYAFGTGGEPLHFSGQLADSGISPQYYYADALAPDQPNAPNCSPLLCPYGLSDFFDFSQAPASFTPIALPSALT